jgi:hypothetical protein
MGQEDHFADAGQQQPLDDDAAVAFLIAELGAVEVKSEEEQ